MKVIVNFTERMKAEGKQPPNMLLQGTHRAKYDGLYQLVEDAKKNNLQAVMIHHPEVLGDNYEELVINLNMVSEAGLAVVIVPPDERK